MAWINTGPAFTCDNPEWIMAVAAYMLQENEDCLISQSTYRGFEDWDETEETEETDE